MRRRCDPAERTEDVAAVERTCLRSKRGTRSLELARESFGVRDGDLGLALGSHSPITAWMSGEEMNAWNCSGLSHSSTTTTWPSPTAKRCPRHPEALAFSLSSAQRSRYAAM